MTGTISQMSPKGIVVFNFITEFKLKRKMQENRVRQVREEKLIAQKASITYIETRSNIQNIL